MQIQLALQKNHRTSFGVEIPIIDTKDYSIYRTLAAGQNGLAAVYITPDDKFRVIKTLHTHTTPTSLLDRYLTVDLRGQLDRELRACLLDHPSIIKIHGVNLEENQIIMDYFGHDLLSLPFDISSKRKFSLLYELADALAAVHSEGIIHSDVKPGNILISERFVAILVDFGSSLLNDAQHSYGQVLNPERYIYCSPEKLNDRPVDFSTDVFSLGMLAYAFYLGGDLDKTIGSAKLSGNIPPLYNFATGEDRRICTCLTSCVSVDNLDRPTALEIKSILKNRADQEKQEIIKEQIAERELILEKQGF